jgi:1,4-alpha-glucan branching enzyme
MVKKTYYKTKDYCKVKFIMQADEADSISILGLNDDWKKAVKMKKKKDGSFSVSLNLPKESRHQYKFLVNGKDWLNDPEADAEIPNIFGGTNSLLIL